VVCGKWALKKRPPGVVAVAVSPDMQRAREGVAAAAKRAVALAEF
jgi:hypothetical protein